MTTLTFNDVTFNPVPQNDGQIWLTASDLSKALGYAESRAVTKIFNRNSDEFSENMTQVIDNPQVPNLGTRIFSLRGCHLVAMFSRTKIAKQFRIWVLDILDKEVGQPTIKRITINIEQQKQIRFAVAKRCQSNSVHYQTVYTALYEHFNIPRYTELLATDFDAAIRFIETFDLSPQVAVLFDLEYMRKMYSMGKTKSDETREIISAIKQALIEIEVGVEQIRKNNATQFSVFESLKFETLAVM